MTLYCLPLTREVAKSLILTEGENVGAIHESPENSRKIQIIYRNILFERGIDMKINIDTKKGKETFTKVLQKTSDAGKKAVSDIQQGAKELSEKAKNDSYFRRVKKYNPLFPETYQSETFNIPNMIMIRDDAERRGIDVCEGAIGWLDNANGMEVLYLYDEDRRKNERGSLC